MDSWPEQLDALTAAPAHHRLLMENAQVRVLETRIEPGETTALHTHRWAAASYFLSWSHMVRRDEHGQVTFDSREAGVSIEPGQATWLEPLSPHTLENVGDKLIHVISVEIKKRSS